MLVVIVVGKSFKLIREPQDARAAHATRIDCVVPVDGIGACGKAGLWDNNFFESRRAIYKDDFFFYSSQSNKVI